MSHATSNYFCSVDLNYESMKLWHEYPDLAVFPGSLVLEDKRPEDATYSSTPLSPEQLATEEPALSKQACKQGARLYQPEGIRNSAAVLADTVCV